MDFPHQFFWVFYAVWLLVQILLFIAVVWDIFSDRRDDPEHVSFWLLVLAIQPLAGFILYMFFGRSRAETAGRAVQLSSIRFHRLIRKKKCFEDHFQKIAGYFHSEDNSDAVLDRLFPERKAIAGNRVQLLHDGTAAYPAMLSAIRSAKHFIYLQSFIIADDPVGREIFKALRERAENGVDVRVLYDRFGSFYAALSRLFKQSKKNDRNFRVHPFSLFSTILNWNFQYRNHRKLLIADGTAAFMGGINISENNVHLKNKGEHFIHDLHCRITGPVVGEFMTFFLQDWFYATGSKPAEMLPIRKIPDPVKCGDDIVRVVASGFGYEYKGCEKVFHTAAATVQRSLWFISPYFVPDKSLIRALTVCASRGVDVRIIVPEVNNHWYVKYACRSRYYNLITGGVRVFERKGVFVHTKAMIADEKWAVIGSSNCDHRSFCLNMELDVILHGDDVIRDLYQEFKTELHHSEEISLRDVEKKTAMKHFLEKVCSLLSPLL